MEGREILRLKSLREQVYEHLRQAIKNLADELGISRQPLRDALIQLEIEGFVSVIPRRGVQVNKLTIDDIRHLYEIIGGLESVVFRYMHQRLGEEDVENMRDLNAQMVDAIDIGDFDAYYELNLQFHDVFLDLSDNSGLLRTVRICKQRLYDFPRERRFNKEWELNSTQEHHRIIQLLTRGRGSEAADFLRDVHWSFNVQRPYIRAYYHIDDPDVRTIANVGTPRGKYARIRPKAWPPAPSGDRT